MLFVKGVEIPDQLVFRLTTTLLSGEPINSVKHVPIKSTVNKFLLTNSICIDLSSK